MARKKVKDFIKKAIKRKGALTALVGGPPGQDISKVDKIAATGTPLEKSQANFFLNVLRPLARKARKRKSLLS